MLSCSVILPAQTVYFKLKESEPHAAIHNELANFSQSELSILLSDYDVMPVLNHPDKFHSVYADRLERTYRLDASVLTDSELSLLTQYLKGLNSIEYVEYAPEPMPLNCPTNDPSDAAWNLSRHDITCVQEAHCITTGDPSIIIAVRDNGFIPGHPELAGQVVYAESGAYDGDCHGTQTAITAAGATDNGFGISSAGYDCSLALYRFGGGFGFVQNYEDMILRGVRIVNNSYGSGIANQAHQDVINLASEQGVIVVGSAGNGNNPNYPLGPQDEFYPASFDQVISVSSVGSNLCCETTYDFWTNVPFDPPRHHTFNASVDLLAQGFAVVTGNCDGGGQSVSYGTSIAGPHVAGIIGLMLSVNPCLNHDDVLYILQTTGQDVSNVCNNASYYPNGTPPVPCAEAAVLAAQNYIGPDLVIESDTDWDQKFVPGNVVIKSGATLTIHGIASMSTNSRIIVEKDADLILNGGTITSCNQEWNGIVVEGDGISGNQDFAGRVVLQNGAVIENARTAISMHPFHLGWPAVSEHWGGLVEADNSVFRNCHRAIEFMKYGTGFIEDQSYFSNCTFEDITTSAVTVWADNNVTFEECNFKNVGDRGIYAYDCEVIVKNHCIFRDQPIGVDILTTYPLPFASKVGSGLSNPNEFRCDRYGVFAQSQGNIEPLYIGNNNFIGGLYGVHVNGRANFSIHYNDMSDGFSAVELVSTGDVSSANSVTNNSISSMSFGSLAAYKNGGVVYLDNCFDLSIYSDLKVNSGSIFIEQGSSELASGNCFTKGGVPEIDNTGNSKIKLWVWENEPLNSCEFPTLIANNPSYNVIVDANSLLESIEECGIVTPGPIRARNDCSGELQTRTELLARCSEIKEKMASMESDSELPQSSKDYLRDKYRRCLHQLQTLILTAILEPHEDDSDAIEDEKERIEAAIKYASSLPGFDQKIMAYGLMVNNGQLIRARKYINGIKTSERPQINFVKSQNINLDYLTNINSYKLSSKDASFMQEVGAGIEPLDGFARSIYEVITGKRIWMEIPDPRSPIEPRSSVVVDAKPHFAVYPNPTNIQSINIVTNDETFEDCCTVRLTDLFGRVVYTGDIMGENTLITTKGIRDGSYIVSILDSKGDPIHIDKIILLK